MKCSKVLSESSRPVGEYKHRWVLPDGVVYTRRNFTRVKLPTCGYEATESGCPIAMWLETKRARPLRQDGGAGGEDRSSYTRSFRCVALTLLANAPSSYR